MVTIRRIKVSSPSSSHEGAEEDSDLVSFEVEEGAELRVESSHRQQLSSGGESDGDTELTRLKHLGWSLILL